MFFASIAAAVMASGKGVVAKVRHWMGNVLCLQMGKLKNTAVMSLSLSRLAVTVVSGRDQKILIIFFSL